MKKKLQFALLPLLLAAMVSNGHAQQTTNMSCKPLRTERIPQKMLAGERGANLRLSGMAKSPRKTVESGVWYQKPEGTFYYGSHLIVPPLTELTYQNMSTNIAGSTWSLEGVPVSTGAKTYKSTYDALRQNAAWPVPQLSVGTDTFTICSVQTDEGISQGSVYTLGWMYYLTKTMMYKNRYIGFLGMPGFNQHFEDWESGEMNPDEYVHRVVQHFPKPASPFYLQTLYIPLTSYQKEKDMLPEGKTLTVRIENMSGQTMATGHIDKEEVDKGKETYDDDDYSYSYPHVYFDNGPIVIDYEFNIVIEGLNYGNQLGLWVTAPELYEQESEGHYTTEYVYDLNGNLVDSSYLWWTDHPDRYWEAVIYFAGMFDVAQVDKNLVGMVAPAEGGQVQAIYQTGDEQTVDTALVFRSSLPFYTVQEEGDSIENYYIDVVEGSMDWLTVSSIEDTEDGTTRITFQAVPYPGPNPYGRTVVLRIRSERGASTKLVTITQVPATGDSFTATTGNGQSVSFTITDDESLTCTIDWMEIGEDGSLDTPESLWGYGVTGIEDGAFEDSEGLTDLNISFGAGGDAGDAGGSGGGTGGSGGGSGGGTGGSGGGSGGSGGGSGGSGGSSGGKGGSVGKNAFKGCTNLTTITIGKNVRGLEEGAFAGCVNVKKVISLVDMDSLWSFSDNVFEDVVYTSATLTVPEGKGSQYEATDGWKNFLNIVDPLATGISSTTRKNSFSAEAYTPDGRQTASPRKGISIIRQADGTMRKVIIM